MSKCQKTFYTMELISESVEGPRLEIREFDSKKERGQYLYWANMYIARRGYSCPRVRKVAMNDKRVKVALEAGYFPVQIEVVNGEWALLSKKKKRRKS